MSGSVTVTILPLPVAPVALAGSGADCSQITANWDASTGTTAYFLDVSTSNTFSSYVTGFQDRNVGNVLTFNVTGLTAGTLYYYRVRSQNSCGTSGNSGTIASATSPAAPAQPGPLPVRLLPCPSTSGLTYEVAAVPVLHLLSLEYRFREYHRWSGYTDNYCGFAVPPTVILVFMHPMPAGTE